MLEALYRLPISKEMLPKRHFQGGRTRGNFEVSEPLSAKGRLNQCVRSGQSAISPALPLHLSLKLLLLPYM